MPPHQRGPGQQAPAPRVVAGKAAGRGGDEEDGAERAAEAEEPLRVLLVEDDAVTRKTVARTLASLGYQVTEAVDGAEALELLEREATEAAERPGEAGGFDLVLTDVLMPRLGGLELLSKVQGSEFEHVPVVVMSALADTAAEATQAGAAKFLQKPVSPQMLEESLGKLSLKEKGAAAAAAEGDGRPSWAALPPTLRDLAAQATRASPAEDGELGHSLKTSAFTAFVRRPVAEVPPQAAAQAGPAGPSAAGAAAGAAVPWQMVGSVAQQQTQLAAVFQMMAQAVHEQMLRQVGSAPTGSPNDAATRRRAAALLRFREKKKNRSFKPKVRYESRKRLAESRPRIKGQFVKPEVAAAAKARGEKVDYS